MKSSELVKGDDFRSQIQEINALREQFSIQFRSQRQLLEEFESQRNFIASMFRPYQELVADARRTAEQIRTMIVPAQEMARFADSYAEILKTHVSSFDSLLRLSMIRQQALETSLGFKLSKYFEPIISPQDADELEEPLFVVDVAESQAEVEPQRQSLITVSFLTPQLVKFYQENPDSLREINRRRFEELIAELFNGFGFEVELTAKTRDGGKDVIAVKHDVARIKYLIECKRPEKGNAVTVHQVRALFGVKTSERATKAILATTTHFSPDAHAFIEQNKWEMEAKDWNGLQEWLRDYLEIKKLVRK